MIAAGIPGGHIFAKAPCGAGQRGVMRVSSTGGHGRVPIRFRTSWSDSSSGRVGWR